ncbi:hypothetical protein [Delftia sp. DT-2]|uniref:hypothetical protein n=1 Tax=Delftia sp. DT-2 TaxID=3022772 RepID=UPI00233F2B1E|nr:hypothetical protein [Delftia sp. DT-2]MDC2858641.1 hypothetical protein [Delftia sp. DT-2]
MLNSPDSLLAAGASHALAIGITTQKENPKQRHVAIIYKRDDNGFGLIHLGWHNYFLHQRWDEEYHWVVLPGLDIEQQELFVDWAKLVCMKEPDHPIPYSILFRPDGNFDSSGCFISSNDGSGLTCATFVLALFSDFGIPIAEHTTWPVGRENDVSWMNNILDSLSEYVKSRYPEYLPSIAIQRLQAKALRRFRPEDVVACAGLYHDTPISFDEMHPASLLVVHSLLRARAQSN